MSLNNILLNSSLLAELYKDSLVAEGQTQAEFVDSEVGRIEPEKINSEKSRAAKSDRAVWNYLGEYKKMVLLVVRYPNTAHLPDRQLSFLTSILTACKLGLGDVAILNISNAPAADYKSISDQFRSRVTALFGITPAEFAMPVDFPEFQVQAFNNCTFLHTPILEELEADRVLKSKLWVCLRRMFDLP
jgi:hypothetical protein